MDVQRVEAEGRSGFRWNDTGTVYEFEADDDAGMHLAFRKAVRDGVLAGETPVGETARLVANAMAQRVGIRKDADGSLIVAWWLPGDLASALAIPGGVAPEDMHLTLLYLGDVGEYDADAVLAVCKLFTMRHGPLAGAVGGMGTFVGSADEDIVVALADVPDLAWLRRCLLDDLACHASLYVPEETGHGFIPHITLAYTPKGQATVSSLTESVPFQIDNLTVAAGNLRVGFAMQGAQLVEADSEPAAYYAKRALDMLGVRTEATDVDKAGRVLSGKNLAALQQMHEALGKVIDAEVSRTQGAPEPEEEEEPEAPKKDPADTKKDVGDESALTYEVTKAVDEQRYTLGPLYAPNRKDAHGEWTDPDTLQKAVWEYVRESASDGRRLNLQHGDEGEITVGEWVEMVVWPYEHTIKVAVPGEEARELTMPAGTVYMGVIWDEAAWPLVKSKKLTGYSLGGKAVKVQLDADLPSMGDKKH